MASRIIHLCIAYRIMKQREFACFDDFILGSLAADAVDTTTARYQTHFRVIDEQGIKRIDLQTFRAEYLFKKPSDFLLGYYCHLISDVLFRYKMNHDYGYQPNTENTAILHDDYHQLNTLLIQRYQLSMPILNNGIKERLIDDLQLDLKHLMKELKEDFADKNNKEPIIISIERAEQLIEQCTAVCLQALTQLDNNENRSPMDQTGW